MCTASESSSSSCASGDLSSLRRSSSWNFLLDVSSSSNTHTKSYGSSPSSQVVLGSTLPDPLGYKYVQEVSVPGTQNIIADNTSVSSSFSSNTSCRHRHNNAGRTCFQNEPGVLINSFSSFFSSGSGLSSGSFSSSSELTAANRDILVKRAWDLSLSPAKSMGMTLLMLYFSGGTSGIFGILIIGYALINSIRTLLSVFTAFKSFDETPGMPNILLQKIVYFLICILAFAYVLYQCTTLGLLPINSGDYIWLIPEKRRLEKTFSVIT